MARKQLRRWPVSTWAELHKPSWLAAQMTLKEMDCADLARSVNARFGTASRPQLVSRQFVSRLRSGKTKRCTPTLAECIATVLDVPLDLLFVVRGVSSTTGQSVLSGQVARRGA